MPRKQLLNENSKKIRTLTLVLTKRCNLQCAYCFEKQDMRDDKIMDFEVAKEKITFYMESNDEYDGIEIDLFGGEPMLCFSLIRQITEWISSKKWVTPYRLLIGTNGTILTDDMKKWLSKNRKLVNVSLSLNGNRTAHNLTRDNSYDQVYPNISFFMENWPHQPAKMTVNELTIPYVAESIIELEEMGINFTANIAFEDFWGDSENKKILLDIYQEQLNHLVDYYGERPHLFPVTPMLTAVPAYLGIPRHEYSNLEGSDCTRYCGAGHEMVTVDVDGIIYPCHRFLPWVTGCPAPADPTNRQEVWEPHECETCKIVDSCPTCAGFNWEKHGNTGHRTNYHCEAYKLEVLASSMLEVKRLTRHLSELDNLDSEKKEQIKSRLEVLFVLIEEGI